MFRDFISYLFSKAVVSKGVHMYMQCRAVKANQD